MCFWREVDGESFGLGIGGYAFCLLVFGSWHYIIPLGRGCIGRLCALGSFDGFALCPDTGVSNRLVGDGRSFLSVPTLTTGFIRCAVLFDARDNRVATVTSTVLLILRSPLRDLCHTVITTLIAVANLTTTPATSHRTIPALTVLDLLNLRSPLCFFHKEYRNT